MTKLIGDILYTYIDTLHNPNYDNKKIEYFNIDKETTNVILQSKGTISIRDYIALDYLSAVII